MIEWEYSRNQRRHTHRWLDKKRDIVFQFQIRATNMEYVINYAKDGYDLYLTRNCVGKNEKLVFIKHAKTVKELKQHAEGMRK